MKKKLALMLFGISYKVQDITYPKTVDYRKSVDNYKKYIFEEYNNMGYDIDVFFATNEINDNNVKNQLISDYMPKKYIFTNEYSNIFTKCKNNRVYKSIELCLEYSKETNTIYDICIITRFDLIFAKRFGLCNIKYNTINLVSILESKHVICDNFYLMPFSMLHLFFNVVKKTLDISGHYIEKHIKEELKIENIHFINTERVFVNKLSFYKIMRNN